MPGIQWYSFYPPSMTPNVSSRPHFWISGRNKMLSSMLEYKLPHKGQLTLSFCPRCLLWTTHTVILSTLFVMLRLLSANTLRSSALGLCYSAADTAF